MAQPRQSVDERKLDVGMAAAYRTWQANADLSPDASIAVTLMHTGDLAAIEAIGFQTHSVFGDQVLGQVRFRDVPGLVADDAVVWIAAGRPSEMHLDTAVRDIRARASAPVTGAPVDGLWHADVSGGALTHVPKATGKGVIVAVIDTGIDFTHPMFIDKAGKTRILRIWDQTLKAASVAECPPVRLLASNDTYGVEFHTAKIQAHLDGNAEIAHRDCDGHGTHVAGIAAGGTNFAPLIGDAEFVGVAPEADIIAVKIPLGDPELKLSYQQSGGEVPWARQFADGVLYCLRTAKDLGGKAVVINMSFGDDASAGDGLDDDSRFIDAVLDPSTPAGDNNFPRAGRGAHRRVRMAGEPACRRRGARAGGPGRRARRDLRPSGRSAVGAGPGQLRSHSRPVAGSCSHRGDPAQRHLANATPQAPDLLAVDISSERVRWAHTIIEGIRNGQPLGALLGYRLERSLHDEPTVYLDRLIYEFRRAFPLAGNRNTLTKVTDLVAGAITKVEARNVVDGAAFADHVAKTGHGTYPYGLSGLPALSDLVQPGSPPAAQIGVLVDRCVTEMRAVADAVADLMLAEGVYQVVRGNYDRAAGSLDAVSKGTHPSLPEVSETPRTGTTLTHRVALHLRGGLSPADPLNTTPRAVGEPALAAWIASQLPDPATVFAKVSWGPSPTVTVGSETPSMAQLGLSPVDLFYLLDAGGAESMPGFDDLLIDYAERAGAPAPRHDAVFVLEYKPNVGAGLTLFDVAPLVRALRGVVLGARPLRPTDLALQNEASTREDTGGVVRTDKVDAVRTDLQATMAAVDAFVTDVDAATGEGIDPEDARDAARDTIDDWIADFAAAVRPVLPFGLPTAVGSAAVEGRRVRFTTMRSALAEMIARWQAKQTEYDDVMTEYGALPVGATDEDRIALLIKAGRVVSTTVIAPLPPLIADLETAVADLRDDLDAALTALEALRDNAISVGATLIAITGFLSTIAAVDQTPFEIGGLRDSMLALAVELRDRAAALSADIEHRVADATAALTQATAAVGDKAQKAAETAAKALLGESFILLPEFTVAATRLAEWNNVWTNRADLLTHLTTGPDATPFPVDDWQHGVARVRERMRNVELTTLLGEALGAADPPTLEALQFPYRADDAWLGLRFPQTLPDGSPFTLTEDKLLYSAAFAAGAEIDPTNPAKRYCGLLLDEWVEVVPSDTATSGLAFHFDRPNSEAPQAVLLATPPVYRGAWQWQDIVDTLHETLDFARLRAVEPAHIDASKLAPLLPAVLASVTTYPITASLNLSFNNNLHVLLAEGVQ